MKKGILHIILVVLMGLLTVNAGYGQNDYTIKMLPLNSRIYNDLAPVPFQNGILFSSDRKTSLFVDYKALDDSRILHLFVAQKKDSLKWGQPHLFAKEITSIVNEGPAAYNEATHTLYFTRNLLVDKRKKTGKNSNGIFYVVKSGNSWGPVTEVPVNDPAFETAHPSVSEDGKTLYFASDRPGGFGKSDIWVSRFENGSWSTPVNLGSVVNTDASELYPFILGGERLYFSSDRPGTLGGLDIFYCRKAGGKWMPPVHLDPPFNSNADDFSFSSDLSVSSGYFASTRDRSANIYSFSSGMPAMVGCSEQVENNYCYLFYEAGERNIDTLPYIYEWDLGDGTRKKGLKVQHCFAGPGTYKVALNVFDTLLDAINNNVATYQVEVVPEIQVYISGADTINTGDTIHFNADDSYLPGVQVTDYFWNFDDGNISKLAAPVHIFQTLGVFHVHLMVKSAPDASGNRQDFCSYKNVVVINKSP